VRLIPRAGQRGDSPQAAALIAGLDGVGHVIADTACDSGALRGKITDELGGLAHIQANPSRATRPPLDPKLYAERHKVENCFRRIKRFRRIALRCAKTVFSFMAFVFLVSALDWLQVNADRAQKTSSSYPWGSLAGSRTATWPVTRVRVPFESFRQCPFRKYSAILAPTQAVPTCLSIVHLICNMTCGPEEVSAFVRWEESAGLRDGLEEGVKGSGFEPSQACFGLGSCHFYGIRVGVVERQDEHPVALCFQDGLRLCGFMGREVVSDHDVTSL
jgi:transposase